MIPRRDEGVRVFTVYDMIYSKQYNGQILNTNASTRDKQKSKLDYGFVRYTAINKTVHCEFLSVSMGGGGVKGIRRCKKRKRICVI